MVRGGKIFCRRVYDLYKELIRTGKRFVKITNEVKADLMWWRQFCHVFNGKSKINNQLYEFPMVSDSSFKGYGIYMGGDWLAGFWNAVDAVCLNTDCNHIGGVPPLSESDANNINVLELWPIIMGIKHWRVCLGNKSVLTFTDNTQVMYMLTNGKTCMSWIHEIFWICVTYNIEIIPRYINTKCNLVADTLSRIPHFTTNDSLKEKLIVGELCCLNELFASHRGEAVGIGGGVSEVS